MNTIKSPFVGWVVEKIREGFTNKQILADYQNEPDIFEPDRKLESVRRGVRNVRQVLDELGAYEHDEKKETKLINRVEKTNELEIALKSYEIKDIDGLIEWSNIDEEIWECYHKRTRASNNQSNPWFIVEGRFRRRTDIDPVALLKNLRDIVEDYIPKGFTIKRNPGGNYCLIIDPVDAHIGAMNHDNSETLQEQIDRYVSSVVYMLQKSEHILLDEIIFVLGNDMFHINSDKPETRKGTPQEIIGIPHEINRAILKMCIDIIFMLKQRCRKLKVITVMGNHDYQNVAWLGLALEVKFSDFETIEIDNSLDERKYHAFGCTAFAFTHKLIKKQDRLSVIMFHEMLSRGIITDDIKYYEVHGGHEHLGRQVDIPSATTNQMITQRVLASLTDQGKYAQDGYGEKTKEAHGFLYSKDRGIEEQFIFRC